jgi:hypothetical protein
MSDGAAPKADIRKSDHENRADHGPARRVPVACHPALASALSLLALGTITGARRSA